MQEEKDSSTGLIPYSTRLFYSNCTRKQKLSCGGVGRCDEYPPLFIRQASVLDEDEAKHIGVVLDGFVIVPYNQGDISEFSRLRQFVFQVFATVSHRTCN